MNRPIPFKIDGKSMVCNPDGTVQEVEVCDESDIMNEFASYKRKVKDLLRRMSVHGPLCSKKRCYCKAGIAKRFLENVK